MRKMFTALFALAAVLATTAVSQTPQVHKHQVVIQMNTDGAESWNQLLGNVRNIQTSFGVHEIRIEVVTYGKGIMLLVKTNLDYEARLRQAVESGVVFAVCQNSMRSRNVKAEELFPFATPVDSGAAELIRRQEAGWSYLRAGE